MEQKIEEMTTCWLDKTCESNIPETGLLVMKPTRSGGKTLKK